MTVIEESGPGLPAGRVSGKVAIVTGAGQVDGPGIGTGKATSILLARHGAAVVLVDREPGRAEITAGEIAAAGGRTVVVDGDVTRSADCARMVRAALDQFGRLDILINNVGVSIPGSVVDLSEDTWGEQIDVNLKSVFLVSKHAIPEMAATGGGSIVNISSVGALRSIGFAAYSAAKGGMISLTQEMAAQHGPQGIRVNVVVPGSIQTPRALHAAAKLGNEIQEVTRVARAVLPLGHTTRGTGWDIAYAALFLASDESSWITGQTLAVDGGACATTPPVAVLQVASALAQGQEGI
jgi:NAD(P)-dependent dehydrogenase (short-subunit alcohol dehydrogenase family)